jgi:hypothetical protein
MAYKAQENQVTFNVEPRASTDTLRKNVVYMPLAAFFVAMLADPFGIGPAAVDSGLVNYSHPSGPSYRRTTFSNIGSYSIAPELQIGVMRFVSTWHLGHKCRRNVFLPHNSQDRFGRALRWEIK